MCLKNTFPLIVIEVKIKKREEILESRFALALGSLLKGQLSS